MSLAPYQPPSSRQAAMPDLGRSGIELMTRREQIALDKAWTEKTGLLLSLLMEQAAFSLTSLVLNLLEEEKDCDRANKILLLAGSGQNGGDVWAAARQLLAYNLKPVVLDLSFDRKLPQEAGLNKEAYLKLKGDVISTRELEDFLKTNEIDFIIDGIFGTGFKTEIALDGQLKEVFQTINRAQPDKGLIAVDVPSGVDADTGSALEEAIKADYTVSFGRPKAGLYSEPGCLLAGEIITAPISMPSDWQEEVLTSLYLSEKRDYRFAVASKWLKEHKIERKKDGHKGSFGQGLIIGGSPGMPGALILAARAMIESGSGYCHLRTKKDILPLLADSLPSALQAEISEDELDQLILQMQAVVAGPGAGDSLWLKKIPLLIAQAKKLLLDADALNYLAGIEKWPELTQKRIESGLEPVVLTPHPAEFVRLAPELKQKLKNDRAGAALALARKSGAIVVLKGHATITATPSGYCFYNTSGNSGLAKAGSGDLLSGIAGSLLAQGYISEIAAVSAVYLHGLAADLALLDLGSARSVTPEIVLSYLPAAFARVGW